MKFRITATSLMLCYGFFEEHTQRFVQKYPQLKELVETEQIKEQEDECYLSETTIYIKNNPTIPITRYFKLIFIRSFFKTNIKKTAKA